MSKSKSTRGSGSRSGRASASKKAKSPARKSNSRWRWWKLLLQLSVLGSIALAFWLVYLDATVRTKFEGKRWSIPAKVYARPLELFDGAAVTMQGLQQELGLLGYRKVAQANGPGTYDISGTHVDLNSRGFNYPDGLEKPAQVSFRVDDGVVLNFGSRAGTALYSLRLDPLLIGGIYPARREDRILVKLDQVPPALPKALVLVEDRQFYEHFGIAPLSILRAMLANLRAGHVVQGGSTLTQQLVKNFYLTNERSVTRKINEAFMAILLDAHYSKDEILEAYLNEVFLGQAGDRAIHGFGMASQFYFGQPLSELSTEKVALLVGLVKGASYYNPRRYPERAKSRRNLVLDVMKDGGLLTEQEAVQLKGKPLGVIDQPTYSDARYPAFMDLVNDQLVKDYQESDLQSEGLRIFTTLDPIVQEQADRSLREGIKRLQGRDIKQGGLQGAMVVTGTESGEVAAVVGGKEPRFAGFNRAVQASRSIGSLVKPAVYLTALMQPDKYNLVTPLQDEPISVKLDNGQIWQPKNYEGDSNGVVPLHYALAHSLNLATAHLGMEMGLPKVVDTLHRLGIEQDIPPYPSLLLGAINLSPYDVARMYQTIAASGFNTPLRVIRAVTTSEGQVLTRYPYETREVVPHDAVHLLQYAMQEVVREGTGRRLYNRVPQSLAVAGKTGTTNDQRDSWFAGFTEDHMAVVWVGRDDNGPTNLTGASGALTIWADLIGSLPEHSVTASKPEDVDYYWIDDATGLLTEEGCAGSRYIPFIRGSQPRQHAPECAGSSPLRSWFQRIFQ